MSDHVHLFPWDNFYTFTKSRDQSISWHNSFFAYSVSIYIYLKWSQWILFLSYGAVVMWSVISQSQVIACCILQSFTTFLVFVWRVVHLCVHLYVSLWMQTKILALFTSGHLWLINRCTDCSKFLPWLWSMCVHLFMFKEYGGGAVRAGVWCIALRWAHPACAQTESPRRKVSHSLLHDWR